MLIDNPLLSESTLSKFEFESSEGDLQTLNVSRTALKALFCAVLVLIGTIAASRFEIPVAYFFIIPLVLIPFIVQMSIQPLTAPVLAPLYSIIHGIILGLAARFVMGWNFSIFSSLLDWFLERENSFPGFQLCSHSEIFFCVSCVVIVMCLACVTDTVDMKSNLGFGLVGAFFGSLLFYALAFAAEKLGFNFICVHNDIIYMVLCCAFSCVVCLPIALCLARDFETVRMLKAAGFPSVMEWYCAAGVIFTIIWAYLQLPVLLFILCMSDDRRHKRNRYNYYH